MSTLQLACDRLPPAHLIRVLEDVDQISQSHAVRRSLTDWPFEHFWRNPTEPCHSRILGYFLDPKADHGCGAYLLRKFFGCLMDRGALPVSDIFSTEGTDVATEKGRIDLCIKNRRPRSKFALIIENKVNAALNQPRQLEKYVEWVRRDGFDYHQIYVLYLPLGSGRVPEASDLAALKRRQVHCKQDTFEGIILPWLHDVTDEQYQSEWPSAMSSGMHENLRHYKNLVTYLVNAKRAANMNTSILAKMREAEKKASLPTLDEIDRMRTSFAALEQNVKGVLRAKLLLRVQSILKKRGLSSSFTVEEDSSTELASNDPFNEQFQKEVNLRIGVRDCVYVCFGGDGDQPRDRIFWSGYMPYQQPRNRKVARLVLKEAKFHLGDDAKADAPWLAWNWESKIAYENCDEMSVASKVAEKMMMMYQGLESQLSKVSIRG